MKSIRIKTKEIKIKTCFDCPFWNYGSWNPDSVIGHYCILSSKEIINDSILYREYTRKQKVLPIPDWCELQDYKKEVKNE